MPDAVRDLAARLGAADGSRFSHVDLTQWGAMRGQPAGRETRFSARQTIHLRRPEFRWRASTGPLGCISITDALEGDGASIEVRAFRFLPIATVRGGAAALKGEIMRYLAELAWAPDAILANPSLAWNIIDKRTLRVSAGTGHARGQVLLHLDEHGRIARIAADDRPRKEGAGFVERPWRGSFSDYRQQQGRWLPFAGEVAWVLDGDPFVTWRGQLLSWVVA